MGRLFKSGGVLVKLAVATVVILVAGSAAYAFASSRRSTITVCIKHENGALYKAKKCSGRDKKLSWNRRGTTGRRGATGPQGQQGVEGPPGSNGSQGPTGPSSGYFAQTVAPTVSLQVPAGNYMVQGQGSIGNPTGSSIQADCFLSANGTDLSAQNGFNAVTIPSLGNGEVSDEGVAHLSAPGTLENTCNGNGGTTFSDAITAIRVGTASP